MLCTKDVQMQHKLLNDVPRGRNIDLKREKNNNKKKYTMLTIAKHTLNVKLITAPKNSKFLLNPSTHKMNDDHLCRCNCRHFAMFV